MITCAIATIATTGAYCLSKWKQKYPMAISKSMGNGIARNATRPRSLQMELPLLNVESTSRVFFFRWNSRPTLCTCAKDCVDPLLQAFSLIRSQRIDRAVLVPRIFLLTICRKGNNKESELFRNNDVCITLDPDEWKTEYEAKSRYRRLWPYIMFEYRVSSKISWLSPVCLDVFTQKRSVFYRSCLSRHG